MHEQTTSKKIISSIKRKPILSMVAAVIVILIFSFGWNKLHSGGPSTLYILGKVERGTLVSSVVGSGQVSSENQLDIKPKVSGDVAAINAPDGTKVKAGDLIVSLDPHDALIALRAARLALDKLTQPADAVSMVQAQNSVQDAIDSNKKATDDLAKAYDDGFTDLTNVFADSPDVVTGIHDVIYGPDGYIGRRNGNLSPTALQEVIAAQASYQAAKTKYDASLSMYKGITRQSPPSSIQSVVEYALDMSRSLSEAVKDTKTAVEFIKNEGAINDTAATTALTNIVSWLDKVNGHVSDLSSIDNTIASDKANIDSTAGSVRAANESLTKLKNGADPIDVETQQLNVTQKTDDYNNYFIRAPFDGTVAKLTLKKGDSVSSGSTIATLVTDQQVATVSLNELDVAKVSLGDKATLTFDAIPDLSLTGVVSDIDAIGTVTQGVVTYNVKITLDTQDDRVKSGMSVSAAIVTDSKNDVLLVPSSAVKTSGGVSVVQTLPSANPSDVGNTQGVPSTVAPTSMQVETGLSNDTQVEITSGLKEGDIIVTRTISGAATTQTRTATSLLGGNNRGGGFGGGGRTLGR